MTVDHSYESYRAWCRGNKRSMLHTSSTDLPPTISCFCASLLVHTSWWTTWCDHLDLCGLKKECGWVKFGYSWRWTPSQLPISHSPSLSFPDLCAEANPTHLRELRTLLPAKSPAVPPASSTTRPTEGKRERELGIITFISHIKKKNTQIPWVYMYGNSTEQLS